MYNFASAFALKGSASNPLTPAEVRAIEAEHGDVFVELVGASPEFIQSVLDEAKRINREKKL